MDRTEQKRLEARGWRVGDVDEFLGLSHAELAVIDLKITLTHALRERRRAEGLTQAQLAKRIDSSQARIARMEGLDHEVTLDALFKALFACGVTEGELARLIAGHGAETDAKKRAPSTKGPKRRAAARA